jgi:hypothetical protein
MMQTYINKVLELPESPRTYLEILKVHNKELPMANLLAYYFRSNETHALGSLFIEALLKTGCYDFKTPDKPSKKLLNCSKQIQDSSISSEDVGCLLSVISKVEVKTEVVTRNNNRIDILINTKDFVICIEFKINHDLNNPLSDYQKHIEDDELGKYANKQYYFIVLTPNKKKTTGAAKGNTVFKQVVLSHFIKEIKLALSAKEINHSIESKLQLNDFIQTIENRGLKYKQIDKLKKIINDNNYSVATAPVIKDSEFWASLLTGLKLTSFSEFIKKSTYHKNDRGGFVQIKDSNKSYYIKVRIENEKWQLEKWISTESKEIIRHFDYISEFSEIEKCISNI